MREELCQYYEICGNCTELLKTEQEQEMNHRNHLLSIFNPKKFEFVPSPSPMNYRYRIALRPNHLGTLGYYKAKTHHHVAISKCSIAHQKINLALKCLAPIPFPAKQIEFRTDGKKIIANIQSSKGQRPSKKTVREWAEGCLDGVGLDGQKMWGDQYCLLKVGAQEQPIGLGTFYQVNVVVNNLLVERIVSMVQKLNPTKVLDLYSGAGNIAFAIASKGIPVTAIEQSRSSVADAIRIVKKTSLPVEIRQGNAYHFEAGDAFFDVAVLDPPRKGASGLFKELSITKPKGVLYVSCNPHALRKDLNEAKKFGYQLNHLIAFEMFPQTKHIELLAEILPQ